MILNVYIYIFPSITIDIGEFSDKTKGGEYINPETTRSTRQSSLVHGPR